MEQVIIIGAGPCGLSAAVELKNAGFDPLIIEKGSIVHSIYRYPTYLIFHSTPELLEIGGVPFVTPNEKPTRLEGLTYYRTVAERHELRIRTYETVKAIDRQENGPFIISTSDRSGRKKEYGSKAVVIATGYFDNPNMLGIPGEELDKVSHYYREAHPYAGQKVIIVGGNNSAVDAALELARGGADVTVVYRRDVLSSHVKAWTRPLFESMVAKGKIRLLLSSQLTEVREDEVVITGPGGEMRLENDAVLALTGFQPDRSLLLAAGVTLNPETGGPIYQSDTMESAVPNLYIAGVVAAGSRANEIFIETGRHHGKLIAADIISKGSNGSKA
ncbi:YpdA family putative bacillithiol disulfide reductase [Gorillibacterium massiliense]|uniref:YpdA family putative bacillithiol disulfide reductase n=1 Tax=Gorillibacterium massiliense TaxID=1280390 RepID=UPI0004B14A8F|nr:YpdA family putative bacillithiol disulfide reductase [Gorillibacterium massiliense]